MLPFSLVSRRRAAGTVWRSVPVASCPLGRRSFLTSAPSRQTTPTTPRHEAGRSTSPSVSSSESPTIADGAQPSTFPPNKKQNNGSHSKLDPNREPDNSRWQLFRSKKVNLPQQIPVVPEAASIKIRSNRHVSDERGLQLLSEKHPWLDTFKPANADDHQLLQLVDAIVHESRVGEIRDVVYLYDTLQEVVHHRRDRLAQKLNLPLDQAPIDQLGLPLTRDFFSALLDVAAEQGAVDNARVISSDMCHAKITPGLTELNKMLDVAAKAKNELFAVEVMDQIAALPLPDPEFEEEASCLASKPFPPFESPRLLFEGQDKELPEFAGVFHPSYVAHWSPETIYSLVKLAAATHNAEFGLSLLGLASIRARQQGNYPASIGDWLVPECRDVLLNLLLFVREPGLAYDLCRLCVASMGDKSLPATSWLALLRTCADLQFVSGEHF